MSVNGGTGGSSLASSTNESSAGSRGCCRPKGRLSRRKPATAPTYTFKIRDGVKFHDGAPLTAADVAASWNKIIHPPEGTLSPRESHYMMVDTVEAPDPTTVVFHLKFATFAFLPALADPFSWIYKKEILDKDPRWYEKNILGSGPFKFAAIETGQSIKE